MRNSVYALNRTRKIELQKDKCKTIKSVLRFYFIIIITWVCDSAGCELRAANATRAYFNYHK